MKFGSLLLLSGTLPLLVKALPHEYTDIHTIRQSTRSLPTVPMMWTGAAFANGTEVTLYGDIQKVNAELFNLNPNYKSNFVQNDSVANLHSSLLERNTEADADCHDEVDPTAIVPILQGVNHLISTGGACHVKALKCTNIYCSDDASIRLCNSNKWEIQPQCNYLATYAIRILEQCAFTSDKGKASVGGTLWDTDQYLIDVISNQEGGSC